MKGDVMLKKSLMDVLGNIGYGELQLARDLYISIKKHGRTKFESFVKSELKPNARLLTPSLIYLLMVAAQESLQSEQGRRGAKAKDEKSGAKSKRESIRLLWANGKYTSRDICAEQESAELGMSFSAARKALRNTPKPT